MRDTRPIRIRNVTTGDHTVYESLSRMRVVCAAPVLAGDAKVIGASRANGRILTRSEMLRASREGFVLFVVDFASRGQREHDNGKPYSAWRVEVTQDHFPRDAEGRRLKEMAHAAVQGRT